MNPSAPKRPADRGVAPFQRASTAVAVLLMGVLLVDVFGNRAGPESSPTSPELARLRIDPNTADADELRLLPGIGPKIASNIIAYRDEAATARPFRSAEDLDDVPRIGPVTVDKLREHLRFDQELRAAQGG